VIAVSIPPKNVRRASFIEVVKAVASGFFGVRKRADHEAVKITPLQFVIVGLIGAAIFVTTLLLVVQFILSRAGAGA
jgi:hypothetical protein